MDFTNRSAQPSQNTRPNAPFERDSSPASTSGGSNKRKSNDKKLWKIGSLAFLVCVVILIAAGLLLLGLNNNDSKSEAKLVKSNDFQAVFLTSGQVYFGHLDTVADKYLDLKDIYYLQQQNAGASASSASSNVQLVKLGCELHRPYDSMVINTDQVSFWENLQSSGQVATAIANYQKANPGEQKCTDQTSAPTSSNSSVQSQSSAKPQGNNTTPTTKP